MQRARGFIPRIESLFPTVSAAVSGRKPRIRRRVHVNARWNYVIPNRRVRIARMRGKCREWIRVCLYEASLESYSDKERRDN